MDPDDSDEFETAVDRRNIILPRSAQPIYEQRLHIRLHLLEKRIVRVESFPGLKRQQGFGSACGTWIDGDDLAGGSASKEKSEIYGEGKSVPLGVSHLKRGQED